jgi:3',5'-cyclic AMP phosphodiesterase CpdA
VRLLAHISDLHFGAEDPVVAAGLLRDLAALQPHLVAISGDLTQRARAGQFRAARAYLDRIDAPQVIVPGNHDVPLYNVLARFGFPLRGYTTHITSDLEPTFADVELAVAGVNTARSFTWKDGSISVEQIERLREFYCSQPPATHKILVAHHPFIPPVDDSTAALVGRAQLALKMLEACGGALILAGHLHLAYAGDVRPHHVEIEQSILVIQAGTAISHRRRDEPNAYNLLAIDGSRLRLEVRAWNGQEFAPRGTTEYLQDPRGWTPAPPASTPV